MKQVNQNANLTMLKGHPLWMVLFFMVSPVFACIQAPVQINFDQIEKMAKVETEIHRAIFVKTKEELTFEENENILPKKERAGFFGNGDIGYYLNVKKAGNYKIKVSDSKREVIFHLILKEDDAPRARGANEAMPQSIPKGISNSGPTFGGCGKPVKVDYH